MARTIPWRKTLGAQLGGITLVLLVLSLLLVAGNLAMLASLQGDSATLDLFIRGRYLGYEMLSLVNRLLDEENAQSKEKLLQELDRLIDVMDRRYEAMLGDETTPAPALLSDPKLRAGLKERKKHWEKIRSALKEVSRKS